MSPFAKVRAVAFDMDQTLIDFDASRKAGLAAAHARIAAAGYDVALDAFLASHDARARAEDDHYLATGQWKATRDRFHDLCAEFALPHDGFADALTAEYVEGRYRSLHPYPETYAVLEALRGRFPLLLVTNGPSAHQHREIDVTRLAPYFSTLLVCDDHGTRKPQRQVFDMLRQAAGVRDDQMLIVGDNPVADIDVPRAMGWATAWVVRDDARRGRADPGRADAVIRSVAEVPGLLGL